MKKPKRTILEIRPVFSNGKVHLDVVEGLALAEVVVIGGSEEAGSWVRTRELVANPSSWVRTQAPGCEPTSWVREEPKLLGANPRAGFLTNPARGFAPREPRLLGANPRARFATQAAGCKPASWVPREPSSWVCTSRTQLVGSHLANPGSWVRTHELGS
ncbi:hypothetical protein SLE2022_132980 [Rubroshorea leprosula]